MAAPSISASFLQADKLRLDIEHRLIALDERATACTTATRAEDKDRIFAEVDSQERELFALIGDFQRIVREVEVLVEKEVSHRRDMWRECVFAFDFLPAVS